MKTIANPQRAIQDAIGDLRIIGVVFVGMWTLIALGFSRFAHRLPTGPSEIIPFAECSLLMLAPGVMYLLCSVYVTRKEAWAARMAQWTAFIHIGLVPVILLVAAAARSIGGSLNPAATAPAIVCALFIPALLAQSWTILRARQAIALLPQSRSGFEVVSLASPAGVQRSDSDREK